MTLWLVRLTHLGGSGILVEHEGAPLVFDPPPREALPPGSPARAPEATALPTWKAPGDGAADSAVIGGVRVEALPYTPAPRGALRAALRSPRSVAARMRRPRRPAAPRVYQLTFPSGHRLVHLGRALHAGTDPAWLDEARARFGGASWVLAGVEHGEEAAVLELLPSFRPGVLLLTKLGEGGRVGPGLSPPRLLTPTVDRLIDRGLRAYPFAGGATYRFSD